MGTPPASPVENAWPTGSQYRDWFLMLLPEEQLVEAERVVNDRMAVTQRYLEDPFPLRYVGPPRCDDRLESLVGCNVFLCEKPLGHPNHHREGPTAWGLVTN